MRTDTNRAEIAPVCGQHSIYVATLGKRGDSTVDQTEIELLELGVKFEGANKIGRQWQLVLIAGLWIEDLGDESSHCGPIFSKKVVHFSEHERRHDHNARCDEKSLIFGKARFAVRCAGERLQESARVGEDWASQSSRFPNSSDSSPSLLSVDSNSNVEGGRRPV